MRKEIKEKVEVKRNEIRSESERIRREATKTHMCANCGRQLPAAKRTYCSDACSMEFTNRFDYSSNSEILREYAATLKAEYESEHPRKEREPWSQPVARKEHECDFCQSIIKKGEKYDNYVRLPEYDVWYDEDPFGVLRYHMNCSKFMSLLYDERWEGEDGFDEDEILTLLIAMAIESGESYETFIENIKAGKFPSTEFLKAIGVEYGDLESVNHWESDHSGYKYAYSVRYQSFKTNMARIHISLSEIKDPASFFSDYYHNVNGDEFNQILSVKGIKIPLPEVVDLGAIQ
jgi:hypothetical protein